MELLLICTNTSWNKKDEESGVDEMQNPLMAELQMWKLKTYLQKDEDKVREQFLGVLDVMLCTRIRLQPICCWLIWMNACKAVHMDPYRICFWKDFKLLHIIASFGIDIADQVPMVREETSFFEITSKDVLTFTQSGIEITSWMLYKSCVWQLNTVTVLWWFGELPQNQVFPIV